MPQGPLQATVALSTANVQTPMHLDAFGNLKSVAIPALTSLDISANTVVKAGPGWVGQINVLTPPSAAGGVYDALTTAAANVTNQMAVIPALTTAQVNTLGVIPPISVNMIAQNGIVILPGTTGQVSVSYA